MKTPDNSVPSEPVEVVTLGDLMRFVAAAHNVPASQKPYLISALKRARSLLSDGASDIRADPQVVLKQLDNLSPAMAGLQAQSYANLKSRVRSALRLAGSRLAPARSRIRLDDRWAGLEAMLDIRESRALSRFLRFSQANGWQPEDINGEHLKQFQDYLRDEVMLQKCPQAATRTTARAWNRAADTLREWPLQRLPIPPQKRQPYWVRPEDLPLVIQQEITEYIQRLANPDLFLGRSSKPLAPATTHQYKLVFIQLASALVASGTPASELASIQDLVSPAKVRTALTFLHRRAGNRVNHQIYALAYRAQKVAQDLGGLSEEEVKDFAAIRLGVNSNAPVHSALSSKNRHLIEHMDNPAFVDRLVTLPARLMRLACQTTARRHAAACARDAVAIELLLTCGMRIGNLVDLHLGETIRKLGQGRDERWKVEIPAERVKNKQPLSFVLLPESSRLIEIFLEDWHHHWCGPASHWLFPAKNGSFVDPRHLSRSIATRTQRHVGAEITAHQFRHLMAEIYLHEDPNGIGVVSQHLGHRDLNTTRRFYAREQTRIATQRYHEVLGRTRATAGSRVRIRKSRPATAEPS